MKLSITAGHVMIYNSSSPSQPMYGVMMSPSVTVSVSTGQRLRLAVYANADNMSLAIYRVEDYDQISLKLFYSTVPPGNWSNISVCLPVGEYKLAFVAYDGGYPDGDHFLAVDNITLVNVSCSDYATSGELSCLLEL